MSTSAALTEFARQLMESKNGAQWALPHARVVYYDSRLWIDKYDVSGQWHWYGLLPVSSQKLVTARYLQWNRHPFGLAETDAAWRVRQADNEDTIVLRGGRKKLENYYKKGRSLLLCVLSGRFYVTQTISVSLLLMLLLVLTGV